MADVRLIDATPIVKFIENGMNNPNRAEAFGSDATEILAEIIIAPTINPDDLRSRGRWITCDYGITECSECHTLGSPQWKCCPVCTAMMDGKEHHK